MSNPFGKDDPIVAVAAVRPDIALFHAPLADSQGNVWVGKRQELTVIARAARKTLVTVEQLFDGNLMESEELAPATLSSTFVAAVSHQPWGALPMDGGDRYAEDGAHLREYARLSRTKEGFAEYLVCHVMNARQPTLI